MKRVYKRVSFSKFHSIVGKLFCNENNLIKVKNSELCDAFQIYLFLPNKKSNKIAYLKNNGWMYEENKYFVLKELL